MADARRAERRGQEHADPRHHAGRAVRRPHRAAGQGRARVPPGAAGAAGRRAGAAAQRELCLHSRGNRAAGALCLCAGLPFRAGQRGGGARRGGAAHDGHDGAAQRERADALRRRAAARVSGAGVCTEPAAADPRRAGEPPRPRLPEADFFAHRSVAAGAGARGALRGARSEPRAALRHARRAARRRTVRGAGDGARGACAGASGKGVRHGRA